MPKAGLAPYLLGLEKGVFLLVRLGKGRVEDGVIQQAPAPHYYFA